MSTSREEASTQIATCCGNMCNPDAILYYIETLEEIIKHLISKEDQFTQNQREILTSLTKKHDEIL